MFLSHRFHVRRKRSVLVSSVGQCTRISANIRDMTSVCMHVRPGYTRDTRVRVPRGYTRDKTRVYIHMTRMHYAWLY